MESSFTDMVSITFLESLACPSIQMPTPRSSNVFNSINNLTSSLSGTISFLISPEPKRIFSVPFFIFLSYVVIYYRWSYQICWQTEKSATVSRVAFFLIFFIPSSPYPCTFTNSFQPVSRPHLSSSSERTLLEHPFLLKKYKIIPFHFSLTWKTNWQTGLNLFFRSKLQMPMNHFEYIMNGMTFCNL